MKKKFSGKFLGITIAVPFGQQFTFAVPFGQRTLFPYIQNGRILETTA